MSVKSVSSNLMTKITLFRNKNTFDIKSFIGTRIVAGIGYSFSNIIAIIESLVLSLLLGLSIFLVPLTTKPTKNLYKRLKSSSFTIIWAFFDSIINLFTGSLIAGEKSAKKAVSKPCYYPRGSLLGSFLCDYLKNNDEEELQEEDEKYEELLFPKLLENNDAQSIKNIEDLPDDCLLCAFTFLPVEDVFNIKFVNKKFYNLTKNENLGEDLIKRDFKDISMSKVYELKISKFSFWKKNQFNNNPDFLNFLLKDATTRITFWGKRKIIFSNGETKDLKKFLRMVFKVDYNIKRENWRKIGKLCIENENSLKNDSLIKKVNNFFRDLFSDAEEIPKFKNLIFEKLRNNNFEI